jgi:hypothetical protein
MNWHAVILEMAVFFGGIALGAGIGLLLRGRIKL